MDGYVSLEVNPHLEYDPGATLREARRLWALLNRPNVLIKIPAAAEGLTVIRQLISEGINVNATLLFGIPRYQAVVEAYLEGLEARLNQNKPINNIASVASFFISRIDTLVDPILENCMTMGNDKAELAKTMHGQIAVACAQIAYQNYQEYFANSRFQKLAVKGARSQRLLWASTGTKNPQYSDVNISKRSSDGTPLTLFRWKHSMPTAITAIRQTVSDMMSSKRGGCLINYRTWESAWRILRCSSKMKASQNLMPRLTN